MPERECELSYLDRVGECAKILVEASVAGASVSSGQHAHAAQQLDHNQKVCSDMFDQAESTAALRICTAALEEFVALLCEQLRNQLGMLPLASPETISLILAEIRWLRHLSTVADALPLLADPTHAAVLWDATLKRHDDVGPMATEAIMMVCVRVVAASERAVDAKALPRLVAWLGEARLPEEEEHCALVLRLMFVLMVRCPSWARPGAGPTELIGSLVDLLESVTLGQPWDDAHGHVALPTELLKALLCASSDLKTFSPEAGRTKFGLQAPEVAELYGRICSVFRRLLLHSSVPADLRRGAIEVCVNAPRGHTGMLAGATGWAHVGSVMASSTESAPAPWGVLPPAGAKAARIVERHWDPARPGYEAVKVWERDDDDDDDDDGAGPAASRDSADDSGAACAADSLHDKHAAAADAPEHIDDAVIQTLVSELDTQVMTDEAANEPYTGALLAVISDLVSEQPTVRRRLKNLLLPRDWDKSVHPEEGESLRARLTRQLRGPDMLRCRQFGELVYRLCNCNAGRLIRRVGYGNAAGYLNARGLADPSQARELTADSDSDSEIDEAVDPMTGRYADQASASDRFADMTDEQKEHTAHELMVLMQKMEKLGIMKPPQFPPT